MKIRRPLKSVFTLFLAALMVVSMVPVSVSAASSSQIQSELDDLKAENKKLQAEINAIQSKYDANASEIEDLVGQKNAIDQPSQCPDDQYR